MKTIFPRGVRWLIGVIHLRPLPGAPRWEGDWDRVVRQAVADAQAYVRGGADALEIENFGDVPFAKNQVPPETVAGMAAVGGTLRAAVELPLGFNVLRNDARSALALCAVCGGTFIRVNVHTGAMLTDQGVIEGEAGATLRRRAALCPDVQILADVHVKHATPLAPVPIERVALDTLHRGLADGLILSGTGSGDAADPQQVKRVRAACPEAKLFIGSGVRADNVSAYLPFADGFIVGSSLKRGGRIDQPVDWRRVAALKRTIEAAAP
jgi:hypothetical protein